MDDAEIDDEHTLDEDEGGHCAELCFTADMSKVILDEQQLADFKEGEIAAVGAYVAASIKMAVVVKEDDLPTKQDIANRPREVAGALLIELKASLDNTCFAKEPLSNASNAMTSGYLYKWKIKKIEGKDQKIFRLRLVLSGFY